MSYKQEASTLLPYLKTLFAKSDFKDDDWTLFIAEEITQNIDIISSAVKLYDIIAEHLEDIAPEEKNKKAVTEDIFDYLKKNKLINPDFITEEEEEVEVDVEVDVENIKEMEDDEDSYVEEGCCLMCERKMLLTKHHVIPKEVHEWYKKHHGKTKDQLHQGIMICRACHSALHSFEDNRTLAEKYSTIENILEHPKVQKWLPYIRKRRPLCKRDHRTLPPNGNRDLPPSYDEYDD